MFPVHSFHSMLRGAYHTQSQTLSLAPGQVIRGEVLKLFTEGHSLVRLGSFHVQAKLEAPLAVGEKSWFQVQSSIQPIVLRMISAPALPLTQDQNDLAQLLRFFGLKTSVASEKLVQFFLTENLPMTKQNLRAGFGIIEQLGAKSETLAAIRFAVQKGLPLTSQVVQGIQAFKYAPDLVTQIKALEDQLPSNAKTELQVLVARLAQDMSVKPNGLQLFLQRLGVQLEASLAKEIQVLASPTSISGGASRVSGTDLGALHPSGKTMVSTSVSPTSLVDQGRNINAQQSSNSLADKSVSLPQEGKGFQAHQESRLLDRLTGWLNGNQARPASQSVTQSFFSQQSTSDEGRPIISTARPMEQMNVAQNHQRVQAEQVTKEEQPLHLLNREGASSKNTPLQTTKGDSFGENAFATRLPFIQQQSAEQQQVLSLKTFLSQLLQHDSLSKQVKDKVQVLIQTIQGQQVIFAAEAQQPFQTYAFQAFYPFGAEMYSLYGQFSGKRNKDGQLDPENCRMLFHLDLPHLGETDIDVNIQAGYVAITFYSLNLPKEGQGWLKENEPVIKEALLGLGYTLTAMQWREVEQGNTTIPSIDEAKNYVQIPVQGVDIRL